MIETAVCMRDMDILCLGTINQVTKDPAPIFTVGRQTTFTVVAGVTSRYTRDDNLISNLKVSDRITDFFDNPNSFVTEDGSFFTSWNISTQNMEVCSTNGRFYQTNNCISWFLDDWFWLINQLKISCGYICCCFHKRLLFCWFYQTILLQLFTL